MSPRAAPWSAPGPHRVGHAGIPARSSRHDGYRETASHRTVTLRTSAAEARRKRLQIPPSQFAAATEGRLRLFFLPGYSPELNPDEWVWKHVKHDRVGRAGVSGPEDLKAKALAALHRLQRLPDLVRSFFRDPNLRYITA